MPVGVRLTEITARLARAGCVAAAAEARELQQAAPDPPTLEEWVQRRSAGEPLAWITGATTFCGHRLHVATAVYVPRPHSEELAHRAAAFLPAGGRALDLCTGTGAIAAHLRASDPTARVVGVDRDPRAAVCAARNGVPTIVGDLADAVAGDATWDVVTAVAPYVPTGALRLLPADVQRFEPRVALDGGRDGLALVGRIVDAAARLLRRGGRVVLELGGEQGDTIAGVLAGAGFDAVEPWWDECDDLRGLAARRV